MAIPSRITASGNSYDKEVNGQCTCGVELVDGARFCHKCGRPVDGIDPAFAAAVAADAAELEPAPQPDAPVAPPPPLPALAIGFRNRESMRAALLSSAVTLIPSSAAAGLSPLFLFGGLVVSGLLCVLLYLRRTGRAMTAIEGARQGWIGGLCFFLITMLLSLVTVAASGKDGFLNAVREQAKAQGTLTPEMLKILDQPMFVALMLLFSMIIVFVLFTTLASLGGMLGARLFGANTNHPSRETSGS
jgi:zinc-ribbon domain